VPTLSDLTDWLDRLRRVRASGTSEVEMSDGRRVAYRTDEQLAAAIADVERQIASMTTTPVTSIRVAASKGLDNP
jgi:hypothetical protein